MLRRDIKGFAAWLDTDSDAYRQTLKQVALYSRALQSGLPFPKTRRILFLGNQPFTDKDFTELVLGNRNARRTQLVEIEGPIMCFTAARGGPMSIDKTYKNYIAGEWREPANGQWLENLKPEDFGKLDSGEEK